MTYKVLFFLLFVIFGFTSCITTYNMSSIQVEIMKPALIIIPEDIDTIAVFKRDLYYSDTTTFKYQIENKNTTITDTTIHYQDLSNKCVDALANYLDNEGYFLKVINYRDSMNYLFSEGDSLINYPELLKKLKVDACFFLDFFQLNDQMINSRDYYYKSRITDNFPEFQKSSKLESVGINLIWTITFKNDSCKYMYRQPDNLYYGNSVYPELFGSDLNHKLLLENTAEYLGRTFGAKIVPSWLKVERSYYRSSNIDMRNAEKYCKEGDWLKAAEIYNRETANKNRNIAAKAKYNMALVCEMEGKLDAAIDWLVQSYSTYKIEVEEHKFNCQQYINLLATRKKEIELLGKQIRNIEINE